MKFNGRNVSVAPNAELGQNVRIGDNTTIYENVRIGDNTVIANDCIIGEPLHEYYRNPDSYVNPPTYIGANSLVRSHAIIYAACEIGENFSSGHRITIREHSKLGRNCRVGTLCDLQGYLTFGDHCWLHSNVNVGQKSTLGNFVFIYKYSILINDPTPPSNKLIGATIGDYSQVGASSVILPGVAIGRHCLVGAGSVVGIDVDDFQLVVGNPAQPVKKVTEVISRETGEAHYPWPRHFERGMPWEGTGFDVWIQGQDRYKP